MQCNMAPSARHPKPLSRCATAILVLALCALSQGMNGQEGHWSAWMRDPSVPLDSIEAAFNASWDTETAQRGKGMKPFQRWLAFARPRYDSSGLRPASQAVFRSIEDAEADKAQEWIQRSISDPLWSYEGPIGPSGLGGCGRLNRVVQRPNHPNEWWACAPAGGLWRTEDAGASWWPMGNGQLNSIGVTDLAFHPTDPNRLWLATGDGDFGDTRSIGIWTSEDGGQSWDPTGLDWATFMGRTLQRVLVSPMHPDTLWVASSLGLYRTLNGGDNWTRTLIGNIASLELDPADPEHLLAGEYGNRIFESHDAGETWSEQSLDGSAFGISRIALAFAPSAPDTVYAVAGNVSDQGLAGVWRSTDNGDTWAVQSLGDNGPNLLGWTVDGVDDGGQAWYDLTIAVSPDQPEWVFVGGVNLWSSSDGGSNWNCAGHWYAGGNLPYVHADQHGLQFLPDGTLLIANDGGAFLYDPVNQTAEDRSEGLAISQTYRLDADPLAMDRFIAGTQDNGTYLKHNGQWEHVLGGDGFQCAFHSALQDVIYASLYYGQIFRSDDGGNAFSEIAGNAGQSENSQGAWLTPWEVSKFNPDWIYMAKDKVYRSTDRGEAWTELNDIPGGNCTALALAPSDVSRLYVAKEFKLYRSTDGQSFDELDVPNGFSWITDIEVMASDANHVFLTLSNYNDSTKVLESHDGGESWINISMGLPSAPINCLAIDVDGNGLNYAGTDVGVYRKASAAGSEWERHSSGLPNVNVSDLVVHVPSGRLVAATYGRGVYTIGLPDPPTKDAALGRILAPRGTQCEAQVSPVLPILNLGTETIHQIGVQYGAFGSVGSDTLWNGVLAPGDSLHLHLSPLAMMPGWSDFSAVLTSVDGQTDERSANNTRSSQLLTLDDPTEVVVSFTSDCFASQNGWVIRDALGRVVHRSGWLPPLSTDTDTLCLPTTCLEFEVHRDQLSGYEALMADCAAPLDFEIRHLDGTPILQAPQTGVVGTYAFCLDGPLQGGCKDPYAVNFDASATFDDGTCEDTCYPLTIALQTDCLPEETGWSLPEDGLSIAPGNLNSSTPSWTLCLDAGCREFVLQDAGANGWGACDDSTSVLLSLPNDTLFYSANPSFSSVLISEICLPPVHQIGCMLPYACNFDPEADGAGTCDFSCFGCTDPTACNHDLEALQDDGSCLYASGCSHPAACNFDLFVVCDDGSCVFAEEGRDCDGQCLSGDADSDGVCDGDEFSGCTHLDACNFMIGATEDDGSCIYPTLAWPDSDEDSFGDSADDMGELFCGVPPPGWTAQTGDCNDMNANVYPGAPAAPLGEDVNCDGFVSSGELAPCSSDLNGDGLTAIEDLLGLLSEFGCTVDCEQDVDGNGAVTSADLLILLAGFGTVCTP